MSTTQADVKVDSARAKVQAWGAAMAAGTWDWHALGHALQLVHEGVEVAPHYQRPWTLLADIYNRVGKTTLARQCLQRSYQLATPGPRHPGGFYREVEGNLRTGYPFDSRGGLRRQEPPDWFNQKYQRYWSIDEVLLAGNPVQPSKIASAFLSYGRQDRIRAERLRSHLIEQGIAVWMDTHDLLAGEPWELVIREALASRDFVICCLSAHAIQKTGFFHVELKEALRAQDHRPWGKVFLVPVRFEDCAVPLPLSSLHYVDLFPDWNDGVARLVRDIREAHTSTR